MLIYYRRATLRFCIFVSLKFSHPRFFATISHSQNCSHFTSSSMWPNYLNNPSTGNHRSHSLSLLHQADEFVEIDLVDSTATGSRKPGRTESIWSAWYKRGQSLGALISPTRQNDTSDTLNLNLDSDTDYSRSPYFIPSKVESVSPMEETRSKKESLNDPSKSKLSSLIWAHSGGYQINWSPSITPPVPAVFPQTSKLQTDESSASGSCFTPNDTALPGLETPWHINGSSTSYGKVMVPPKVHLREHATSVGDDENKTSRVIDGQLATSYLKHLFLEKKLLQDKKHRPFVDKANGGFPLSMLIELPTLRSLFKENTEALEAFIGTFCHEFLEVVYEEQSCVRLKDWPDWVMEIN